MFECVCFAWSDIEKMISLKGMIIRSSSIIPEIREAVFRCLVCGYFSDPIIVDRGKDFIHLFNNVCVVFFLSHNGLLSC